MSYFYNKCHILCVIFHKKMQNKILNYVTNLFDFMLLRYLNTKQMFTTTL